jgi:hypothetical protein
MGLSPYAGLGTYSSLLNPYCKQVEPFSTTYKANASYLVPKIDVQVSGTFSSRPGAVLARGRDLPGERSDHPRHARPPAGGGGERDGAAHRSVRGVGDRIDRWTCASARSCGFGRTRSNLSLDIVNLFNSNDNLAYQTLLSPTWPAPTQVLLPRIFRVNFGIDW